MQRTRPFARFYAVMAAMAAVLNPSGAVMPVMTRAAALEKVGGYQSKGKTGSKPHYNHANMAQRRLAKKRRNVVRNRKAQRRAGR